MTTPVFLTVDTEFAWRHHAAGLGVDAIYERSIEPADVGIRYQLAELARHDLKACFFVDPMPAVLFGLDPIRRIVETILAAGQEVQLHLHANWTGATVGDRGATFGHFALYRYSLSEQIDLLTQARDLLVAAGAPAPIAFRAGSYAANDDTLAALASLGFVYDSSHNGAEAPDASRITLPPRQIAPTARGVVEVPVTVIEDSPGRLRTFQLCALSVGESYDALEHAAVSEHAAVTIVSHGFELANRSGTRANAVHVRRFRTLCAILSEMRDVLPTVHFADRPDLPLDRQDLPLGPDRLRKRWRQAEQLWSNWVAERA
ncbi:polysaccharide deacetylase [Sphingomonas ginsenosidivorax]|uniref:Polysaccharide deacetylase n=1 Tax=Sphingomonas ginsenosidivorax TaxID=862135 RepID=A0A5C6UIG7_9SPHN|nr:polysaccharide deacetylase [Sphingomonas ginsenosidivorax]TXC72593.1 polysaccharide deacetylase [Sphingomonas ginsenosidivorax]